MRRIPVEKARALRKEGKRIVDEEGKPIWAFSPAKPPVESPAPPKPEPVRQEKSAIEPAMISAMLDIMRKNEENIEGIVTYGQTVATALAEMAKPRKKKWSASVGRDSRGNINQLNIEEQ